MTITIDSTDKRSVRALAVLNTSDRWHRGQTTRGVDCAHMLAVRLQVARLKATEPKRKPAAPAFDFYTAASIGGTIQAPEAARRRCLADDIWGVDGE